MRATLRSVPKRYESNAWQVDSLSFPIPQFIVIGKQSVGKSRLIEARGGES